MHEVGYKLHLDVFVTGWTVQGSNLGGGEIFRTLQTAPVPIGTESFPAVKRLGPGVDHPPPPGGEFKKK